MTEKEKETLVDMAVILITESDLLSLPLEEDAETEEEQDEIREAWDKVLGEWENTTGEAWNEAVERLIGPQEE